MKPIALTPIGSVRSTRQAVADDDWDKETAFVELDAAGFTPAALAGLADFSHVEVIFYMDQVAPEKIERTSRRPRNNPDWPEVGIFAQRGKNRPNQLGTTLCRIIRVDGLKLFVEGLDAVDGTPVLDLKPWVAEFGPRGDQRQPIWISELMRGYWKPQDRA